MLRGVNRNLSRQGGFNFFLSCGGRPGAIEAPVNGLERKQSILLIMRGGLSPSSPPPVYASAR